MRYLLLILILVGCSASGNKKNCEMECTGCEQVKFTCGSEDKTVEAGDPTATIP